MDDGDSAHGSNSPPLAFDMFSSPEAQYGRRDYENLSEMLAQQLEDVGSYFSSSSSPDFSYFSDLPHETVALSAAPPPPPGSALDSLLAANVRYQQALREKLVMLEEGQRMTRDLQRWLKMLQIQMNRRRKTGAPESPLALVDSRGEMPPENEECRRLKPALGEYNKAMRPPVKWTEREKMALAKGVRQQNQTLLVDRILAGEDILLTGQPFALSSSSIFQADRSETYQHAISTVQRMSQRELEMNLEGIDWAKAAALFVKSRSAEDCRIQWTTNQHPLISHAAFSPAERTRLAELVQRYGARGRWIEIAEALGSNRTAWQCLAHYRQAGGRSVTSGKWTEEEDRILIEGVQHYGTSDCWTEISELLDGRTPSQCVHRWTKTLDPNKKVGRWTCREDAWLLAAVRRLGSANWSLIAQFVPHRTDVQCRERFMNILDPQLKHDTFSSGEDALLREAVALHGEGRWSQVAAMLPNRTDNQCRRRWLALQSGGGDDNGSGGNDGGGGGDGEPPARKKRKPLTSASASTSKSKSKSTLGATGSKEKPTRPPPKGTLRRQSLRLADKQ